VTILGAPVPGSGQRHDAIALAQATALDYDAVESIMVIVGVQHRLVVHSHTEQIAPGQQWQRRDVIVNIPGAGDQRNIHARKTGVGAGQPQIVLVMQAMPKTGYGTGSCAR
jgi:hypothetical protein